ncbi:hypothetical protein [Burkholderia stagnalis]|uniref:hypothetical protein n=1 Tax=Burkholderia stagnalis TaxID=1503054 RepID=UPI000F562505|nr:hypothetical protein [Burkholderia stagnalis]
MLWVPRIGAIADVFPPFSNIRASFVGRAAASRAPVRCRMRVRDSPSACTATPHGGSAASHYNCASLPHDASLTEVKLPAPGRSNLPQTAPRRDSSRHGTALA